MAVVFLGYVGAEGESGQQNANDDQTSSSSGSSPSTPATATKEPEFYDHVNRFVRTNYANFTDEQKSELITFTESLQNEITLNTSKILGFGETFPDDLHANVSVQLRQGTLNQDKVKNSFIFENINSLALASSLLQLDEVAELSHKARKRYIMFAIENLNATADKLGVSPFDFCHETGKDCSHLERSAANSNSGTAQDSGDANGVGSEEADSTESQAPQLNFSTLQSITSSWSHLLTLFKSINL